MVEIVVLALLAGFIALRLISVLGNHDESSEPQAPALPREPSRSNVVSLRGNDEAAAEPVELPSGISEPARKGLQAIMEEDTEFDPAQFLEGATAAYRMILESFWSGDREALRELVSDDVADDFTAAIDAREEDGLSYDNKLVGIENAEIIAAERRGQMAEVTVRFDADLIAITRSADGTLVAGSESDATETHDVWTFSRHIQSGDPAWLLIETDSAG